jgi:hypothetical protein
MQRNQRKVKWSMANNIIGYAGIDTFDIMLYLSRILLKLGRKVLLVDHSETQALSNSIPKVEGLNPSQGIISFRHVDFTLMTINDMAAQNYDDILISYGFNEPAEDKQLLTRIIYTTDLYEYNLDRVNSLIYYDPLNISRQLLIRDILNIKITPEIIAQKIHKDIKRENVKVLYQNESDLINRLICNCNKSARFMKISGALQGYLIKEAVILFPQANPKLFKNAYRKARKGD